MRLEDFLTGSGFVDQKSLDSALEAVSKNQDLTLGEIIVRQRIIPIDKYSEFLDVYIDFLANNLDAVAQSKGFIDYSLAVKVGATYCRENQIFPIEKVAARGSLALKVMVKDRNNVEALDHVKKSCSTLPLPLPTRNFHPKLFDKLLEQIEQNKNDKNDEIEWETGIAAEKDLVSTEDKRIVDAVNRIIKQGVEYRASDIHLRIEQGKAEVRYRIDGALGRTHSLKQEEYASIVSRIKIMCGMDIAERRMPQDGKIRLNYEKRGSYDIRVSTLARQFGEGVVMRLLSQKALEDTTLDTLEMEPDILDPFRRLLLAPKGLILVTGPTGSGKTTTLYASLKELLATRPEKNIDTVEDPVEYTLKGVNQCSVDYKINKTFEVCLRALLRQDPDNIMVGEMRDLETAKMAVRAALTGHLVLSTLHTNSTAETITRLMDMGIESYLVAPTLLGIMGQRLVRRICNGCREETSPQNAELFIAAGLDPIAYQGTGCGECFNTGYKGRIGIYEYFPVAPAFVPDISSMEAIGKLQQKREVISFLNYGLRKVSQGLTTESEVLENTAI